MCGRYPQILVIILSLVGLLITRSVMQPQPSVVLPQPWLCHALRTLVPFPHRPLCPAFYPHLSSPLTPCLSFKTQFWYLFLFDTLFPPAGNSGFSPLYSRSSLMPLCSGTHRSFFWFISLWGHTETPRVPFSSTLRISPGGSTDLTMSITVPSSPRHAEGTW